MAPRRPSGRPGPGGVDAGAPPLLLPTEDEMPVQRVQGRKTRPLVPQVVQLMTLLDG